MPKNDEIMILENGFSFMYLVKMKAQIQRDTQYVIQKSRRCNYFERWLFKSLFLLLLCGQKKMVSILV